jgi:hypothetical protein
MLFSPIDPIDPATADPAKLAWSDPKTDLVELVSGAGIVPLINITGDVPPPIMASVAAEKLDQWRKAYRNRAACQTRIQGSLLRA